MASRAPIRLTAQRKPRKGATAPPPLTGTFAAILAALSMSASGAVTGATAVTLSGPTSGTVSAASTFTFTPAAAGAASISITNNGGLANLGSPISFAAATAVAAGTWQTLTVAPHSRKVISSSSPSSEPPEYNVNGYPAGANNAQAGTEALPITPNVMAVPLRGYNPLIRGDWNTLYYAGSLHSGYRGNEIDRMVMPFGANTEIVTTISHQPNSPASGAQSGYATGASGYIYKVSFSPQGVVGYEDQTSALNWQTFKGHTWTSATWAPHIGYSEIAPHAVQTGQTGQAPYHTGVFSIVGGVLQCSHSQPTDGVNGTRLYGLVGYDWDTGRYKTEVSQLSPFISTLPTGGYPFNDLNAGLGMSGLSDWSNFDQSILMFNSLNGLMNIMRWNPISGMNVLANQQDPALPAITNMGFGNGHSSNGWLIRHLEVRKYLLLRQNLLGRDGIGLYLYSEDFAVHRWTGSISGTVMTVSSIATDKFVLVGQHVTGAGVAANTKITGFLSGLNGREGTYSVSVSQNVPSTTLSVDKAVDRTVDLTPSLPGSGPGQPFEGTGNASDPLSFTVDRNSRRVFWLVAPIGAPIRLYVSTFGALMTWTPITTTNAPTWPDAAGWHTLNRQPLHFMNGYLFLHDNIQAPNNPGWPLGAMGMKRVKVDAGEDLPTMTFTRHDYRKQNFTFSSDPGVLQLWGVKHSQWAYRPTDGKHYLCAGDLGSSTCGSLATLQFGVTANGYQFVETLNETALPPAGKVRPSSPDDGYWFYVPASSAWVAARGKFVWQRGGDGEPMFYNAYLRRLYGSADSNGTIAQVQAAIADGWDIRHRWYMFDPDTTTFTTIGASYTFNANGNPGSASATLGSYDIASYNGWTQDNGSNFYPDLWGNSVPSAASRNGAFDSTTGCVWRFYNTGTLSLARFDFVNKTIRIFNLAIWISPDTGRHYFTGGSGIGFPIVADGPREAFGYEDTTDPGPFSGEPWRWKIPLGLNQEHKATWIDERDGKLYVVDQNTGYLWCFETRGPQVDNGGWTLPFYPVGKRIPTVGTWPLQYGMDRYPPWLFQGITPVDPSGGNGETRMNQFLVPFKGGLLWWGSVAHDGGTFGRPIYAFWRRLGFEGAWTVVSMPQELAANSHSVVSKAFDNPEVVMLAGGGNYQETPGPWPWFWRLT